MFNPVIGSVTSKPEKDKLKLDKVERDVLLEYHRKWEDGIKQKSEALEAGKALGGVGTVVDTSSMEFLDEGTGEPAMNSSVDSNTDAETGEPVSWIVQDQSLGEWLKEIEALECVNFSQHAIAYSLRR